MAALVTGLIPILRTAVDATTTYKCRSVWFGVLSIRLVILFLSELPFTKLDADFTCNGTRDSICTRDCFNKQFKKPIMVAWNFIYVLVVISVLLMELFTSHLRSLAQKRSAKQRIDVELAAQGKDGEPQVVSADSGGKAIIDFHRDRGAVGFYLLSIILRILIESWFMYVLLYWNLPALSDKPFHCPKSICSELNVCILRAAPEKRMSVYALATISGVIIICSVAFCLYSIAHYLCHF